MPTPFAWPGPARVAPLGAFALVPPPEQQQTVRTMQDNVNNIAIAPSAGNSVREAERTSTLPLGLAAPWSPAPAAAPSPFAPPSTGAGESNSFAAPSPHHRQRQWDAMLQYYAYYSYLLCNGGAFGGTAPAPPLPSQYPPPPLLTSSQPVVVAAAPPPCSSSPPSTHASFADAAMTSTKPGNAVVAPVARRAVHPNAEDPAAMQLRMWQEYQARIGVPAAAGMEPRGGGNAHPPLIAGGGMHSGIPMAPLQHPSQRLAATSMTPATGQMPMQMQGVAAMAMCTQPKVTATATANGVPGDTTGCVNDIKPTKRDRCERDAADDPNSIGGGSMEGRHRSGTAGASVPKVCINCGVSRTPFWRKEKSGRGCLCNACGLYMAKNDAPRPRMLWRGARPD